MTWGHMPMSFSKRPREIIFACANFEKKNYAEKPASWSSGNAFVSEEGGLRFKSRDGQIRHSVANGSPPL